MCECPETGTYVTSKLPDPSFCSIERLTFSETAAGGYSVPLAVPSVSPEFSVIEPYALLIVTSYARKSLGDADQSTAVTIPEMETLPLPEMLSYLDVVPTVLVDPGVVRSDP